MNNILKLNKEIFLVDYILIAAEVYKSISRINICSDNAKYNYVEFSNYKLDIERIKKEFVNYLIANMGK